MKRLLFGLALLIALAPFGALAAPPTGAWQVYTIANGLRELQSYHIAPDGTGGVWVGHVSGGRGVNRRGGLAHVRADGNGQSYGDEPFQSCSSVDALALAPDNTLWMRLSGYHDYGSTDYLGRCGQNYGVTDGATRNGYAIGFIGADGVPQMLPKEQQPADATAGLAVDQYGRPWVGTRSGAAVREADGSWRALALWSADDSGTSVLRAFTGGGLIVAGSASGAVATISMRPSPLGGVSVLPRPSPAMRFPVSDIAPGPGSLTVVLGRQIYRLGNGGESWDAIDVPVPDRFTADELIYGQHLANVGGKLWIGAPQYGLFRLDDGGWTAIEPGVTPLPNSAVNNLATAGDLTLLVATEQGAARIDTIGDSPDPSGAQRAFDTLWQRTNLGSNGTWVWGPRAWDERYEPFKDGPGGSRFVRYFDKARMEVSDPQANPDSPWYVTNGLLVVEMVRGRVQFANDPALSDCPYFRSGECPAIVQVAGDIDLQGASTAPSYQDFGPYLAGVEARIGARVGMALTRAQPFELLTPSEQPNLATDATTLEFYDQTTQHNIPRMFWSYMRAQPADWLFAFGHPISEPYWVRTKIGGTEQWVLLQLFERRTLTYTPANSPAWQVEMGNVGQHYYAWRYGVYENPPWAR
jgi:hypothetical protein